MAWRWTANAWRRIAEIPVPSREPCLPAGMFELDPGDDCRGQLGLDLRQGKMVFVETTRLPRTLEALWPPVAKNAKPKK